MKNDKHTKKSPLMRGNQYFRAHQYDRSLLYYTKALLDMPELFNIFLPNLAMARKKYYQINPLPVTKRSAFCNLHLNKNPMNFIWTPENGQITSDIIDISRLLRFSSIDTNNVTTINREFFLEISLKFILKHPFQIIYLTNTCKINIIFGILYQIIWNTNIMVDINNDDLLKNNNKPTKLITHILIRNRLPNIENHNYIDWRWVAECFMQPLEIKYRPEQLSILDKKHSTLHQFQGKKFTEKINLSIPLNKENFDNHLCIFSHYDADNQIDDYVLYYLEKLHYNFDIIFVSTSSSMSINRINKLEKLCIHVIVKENDGYDFGAWKSGLNLIGEKLNNYNYLLLCNDSVYGPLQKLDNIIKQMNKKKFDVWAMTDSMEIEYHLQSYFVFYTKNAFNHKIFKEFWKNIRIHNEKAEIILYNEVQYSAKIIACKELSTGVYYSVKNQTNMNITHSYWRELINCKFPFIKIELLRKNPMHVNIQNWQEEITKVSEFPIPLIDNHLKRFI